MSDIKAIIMTILFFPLLLLYLTYSNQYRKDVGSNTASNGVIFKGTIDLNNYSKLGEGTNLMCLGSGHIKYTRSLTHEVFTVCK